MVCRAIRATDHGRPVEMKCGEPSHRVGSTADYATGRPLPTINEVLLDMATASTSAMLRVQDRTEDFKEDIRVVALSHGCTEVSRTPSLSIRTPFSAVLDPMSYTGTSRHTLGLAQQQEKKLEPA